MNLKKNTALALALTMALGLTACSGGTGGGSSVSGSTSSSGDAASSGNTSSNVSSAASSTQTESDMQYVKDKGTLVVGMTEFAPMDYQDENGNWIGFDADLATAFAEYLGVEVVFQPIDWDSKVMELDGKTIDVVWNGMTLTDDVKASMECSNPYFSNAQVAVVPADKAADYQTVESLKDLTFAVEIGSAGKEQADANGLTYTEVGDQATALLEVSSGTADAAIIDFLMAAAMTGEGTSYADLAPTVGLNSEEYGVGFRKGSDLAEELNTFFAEKYADGTMQTIAEQYNIADRLLEQ